MHVTHAEFAVLSAADRVTYCFTNDAMYVLSDAERQLRADARTIYYAAYDRHNADHNAWVAADAAGRLAIELADAEKFKTHCQYPIRRGRYPG